MKATKKLPEISEIFAPGERGNRLTDRIRTSGKIEIEENLFEGLKKAANTG